ncbi:hypothetical protein BX616_010947, partial [Lobosporangium transversale]
MVWLIHVLKTPQSNTSSSNATLKLAGVTTKHKHVRQRSFRLLDIPEILEIIIGLLSFGDRRVMRLVSRQCYIVSRRFLTIRAVWTEAPVPASPHHAHVLRWLSSLDALSYVSEQTDDHESTFSHNAWFHLRNHIQSGLAFNLEELILKGPIDVQGRILPLLPFMASLRTIRLQGVYSDSYTIPMFLNECPRLEELTIEPDSKQWTAGVTPVVKSWTMHRPYKLRVLSVQQISMTQHAIRNVIECCPNLRSISLIGVSCTSPTSGGHLLEEGLIAHIARWCPELHHLQISTTQDQQDSISQLAQFRHITSLGMPGRLICPHFFTVVRSYPNALTVLTITGSCGFSPEITEGLHSYLCKALHLKHLEAPDIKFNEMLLFHTDINNSESVWACRDLRSLKISFQPNHGEQYFNIVQRSRMIYGYISQVCPQLRHLAITREWIDCSLEGGLCLLTGLESLISLEVTTTTMSVLHAWDFSWMDNDPTVLHKMIHKMSSNESKLLKSLRAKYEWLGYGDCRFVDPQRLERLGLLVPALATTNVFQGPQGYKLMGPLRNRRKRSTSSASSASSASNDSRLFNTSKAEPSGHLVRWPFLKRFIINLSVDRR